MKRIRGLFRFFRRAPKKLPMSIEEFPPEERAWREALIKKQTIAHQEAHARQKEKERKEAAAWWQETGQYHHESKELMKAGDYEAAHRILDQWWLGRNMGKSIPWREHSWPLNITAAVERILAVMTEADRERIRATERGELILFHHGMGTWIRNEFGLWKGNLPLLLDTGHMHADDSSGVIIENVWQALQSAAPDREREST